MSTPANTGSGGNDKKRVGRLLSRMKTVLRRSDGSKRLSLSGRSPAAAATATTPFPAGPSTSKTSDPDTSPAPLIDTTEPETRPDGPQPVRVMRSQIDSERADRLAQRFKLPKIEAYEFPSQPDREALRIEKPIRMRIHRICHKCQTTFGGNKICATCEHQRCSKCPRYPVKKNKTGGDNGKGKEASKPPVEDYIEPDTYWGMREKYVLTLPSRTGGQPLVRKKPVQRVRRHCHQCSALFQPGEKICSSCEHVRCADCPRDPAKKKKFPDGYPGDAYSTTSLLPLKYSCHQCSKVFAAIPHPNSPEGLAAASNPPPLPECTRCGHEKCSECPRAPIVKVDPAPDPEVVKSVEAKLAAMNVGASVDDVVT